MAWYIYDIITECDSTCSVTSDERLKVGDTIIATITLENGTERREVIIAEIAREESY